MAARNLSACMLALLAGASLTATAALADMLPNGVLFPNPAGFSSTHSTRGRGIDLGNPFFQDLGSNGRSCASCHVPSTGWTVTPAELQERFDATGGTDPVFRTNDGSNSPSADVSTVDARRSAYSMLLMKGDFRVGIGIPAGAEFELVAADDPYGFASADELSLFRRPMPTTNLKFLSAIMWDGRETFSPRRIHYGLRDQSNGATMGHAAALQPLTYHQRVRIVRFETSLYTAQAIDSSAGSLTEDGGRGGPQNLARQRFYHGINDNFGDMKTGQDFNPIVFDLYDSWKDPLAGGITEAQAAIARGQELFNTKPIEIAGVSGINDEEAFGKPAVVVGTCTTCHDTPNAGGHSVAAPLNIGLADAARRTPDMPLYTLRNKATGETVQTTDPGRALITGKWKDIGRFKGAILRGLAARPPYFHDGSASDLGAVVDFYNGRFGIGLTAAEKADLVAFLSAL